MLAHLIGSCYEGNLETAVRHALARVRGAYGIAVIHADEPGKLVGARNGSPLVIGIGDGINYVASDVAAILHHTRQVIYLDDEYRRTIIGRSARDYVWLMARSPELEPVEDAEMRRIVSEVGYDPARLHPVPQRWPEDTGSER
mgnify:CR=1 FL=1